MDKIIVKVGAVTLAAFVGFSGFQVYQTWKSDPFAACRSGAIAGGVIGGKFTLLDEDARTVTDADVIAKPALVYFGYASCPDACPLDNMRNVEAADLLAKQGFDVTPVFISVDPARDTPAVMKSYTDGFGPNLLGLTGSPEQIKVAAAAYKVYYKLPDPPGQNYSVDHSSFTYLVLPRTGFAEFFTPDVKATEIAERAGCFLKAR